MISLDYLEAINLCVLCVFVVRSSWSRVASALRPPAGMYPIIHFTHQTQESQT
ncbi:Genome sequencing data, contig C319 (fragment) [Microcystis aeruginosa PCC 9701]|uniref:Genome sequencing data, contig C319 n=1 Tax=Microcystis aeruginosa PCC 9701 TaxID=721123 RepID=I4ILJ7_MICAE